MDKPRIGADLFGEWVKKAMTSFRFALDFIDPCDLESGFAAFFPDRPSPPLAE